MSVRFLPLVMATVVAGCAQLGFGTAGGPNLLDQLASHAQPTPATRPLQGALGPVRFPLRSELGTIRFTQLATGAPGQIRLSLGAGTLRAAEDDGCIWHRAADWFAPSRSWQNCGTSKKWRTGRGKVRVLSSLYPLEVGATGEYEREARSDGGQVSVRRTRCEVTDAVDVVGASGKASPAFVVECNDGRRVRKTWYAPNVGPVAYVQTHRKRGVEDAWQRVF